MKHLRSIFIAVAVVVSFAMAFSADAKKKAVEVDIYDLSLGENLATPEPENAIAAEHLVEFQDKQAGILNNNPNYEVEMMRDREVIVITILASKLFDNNDTTLTKTAAEMFHPLLPFLKIPGMYKMMLVMHHCANLGSDAYAYSISQSRVNAVFDWFAEKASVDYVVPYAVGNAESRDGVDNNSIEARKLNRRLEIYLVPDDELLELAKKDKIKGGEVFSKKPIKK